MDRREKSAFEPVRTASVRVPVPRELNAIELLRLRSKQNTCDLKKTSSRLVLKYSPIMFIWGAVVRALASRQCGPGTIPGLGVVCGLSFLLVLVLAPRGFSRGTLVFPSPQKPEFPNSNLLSIIMSSLLGRLRKF